MPVAEAEGAADALWQSGASAVGEEPRGGVVVLTADLDVCPPALSSWAHEVSAEDGAWWDGWRPFARAVTAGPFVVRPPWVEVHGGDAAIELVVDAGRSFGTGAHPSTTLALRALAGVVTPGASVLDAGCGSGALAIGAALLGATKVVAVDVDPAAIAATTDNIERNGVGTVVEPLPIALEDAAGRFDVVVANLGVPLVFDLAGALAGRCAAGGVLVLSGMLGDHTQRFHAAYGSGAVAEHTEEDGWTCVVLRPRESPPADSG